MKTFAFVVDKVEYHLRELDLDTKTDIADRMTVGRRREADRRYKKGLTTEAEYLDEKATARVKWGGRSFVHDLQEDPDMQRAFAKALLVEPVDDAKLAKLLQSPEFATALELLQEDDDPEAGGPPDPKVPPPSA